MNMNQINWRVWYWPWHTSKKDDDFEGVYSHFAGVGPFQFHWYSKSRWL